MKILEKHVFGGSKDRESLAILLNECGDTRLARRIGLIFAEFSKTCSEMIKHNITHKNYLIELMYRERRFTIDNLCVDSRIREYSIKVLKDLRRKFFDKIKAADR